MSRFRRIIAAVVGVVLVGPIGGLAPSATAARAKTCQMADARYDVTTPPAGSGAGADPAEVAAANCTPRFDEQNIYPLSVIGLCLLMSVSRRLASRILAALMPHFRSRRWTRLSAHEHERDRRCSRCCTPGRPRARLRIRAATSDASAPVPLAEAPMPAATTADVNG